MKNFGSTWPFVCGLQRMLIGCFVNLAGIAIGRIGQDGLLGPECFQPDIITGAVFRGVKACCETDTFLNRKFAILYVGTQEYA